MWLVRVLFMHVKKRLYVLYTITPEFDSVQNFVSMQTPSDISLPAWEGEGREVRSNVTKIFHIQSTREGEQDEEEGTGRKGESARILEIQGGRGGSSGKEGPAESSSASASITGR